MMFIVNYLFALLAFTVIYLAERLVLFWLKKKAIWPLVDYRLLVAAIAYSGITLILLGILHIVFKKVHTINLLWLDTFIYIFVHVVKPGQIYLDIKNKEKLAVKKNHIFGATFFVFILLECFLFNAKAYSGNKETVSYQNFINETITSDGEIQKDKIVLKSKQTIIIKTLYEEYDNLYLKFNNDDMNLYVNIFEMKDGDTDYTFKKYVLIDPAIDSFGYISLDNMSQVSALKIEFDIDDSRYLNNSYKPSIVVTGISFNAYFPLIINPLRLGGLLGLLLLGFNFRKLFLSKPTEELNIYQKLEKMILFGGAIVVTYFIIQALFNSSAYFVKYDQLYLGGDSSRNIYYQQFDAYLKGQLHLDVPVDSNLAALSNPYDPYARNNTMTVLWDHAFYNGKYYCYYGHAPIYLVMLPVYWLTKYVPTNLFVLQLGTLFSIFAFLLGALQIIKLFIKKVNPSLLVLTLVAMVFGSLLLCSNTYQYGDIVYRIPYAYANGFLFLTIYLFLKGYQAEKKRFLYFIFTGLSLVFIVLSRPLEAIYLILFIPIIIRMIKNSKSNRKQMLIDYVPALGVVLVGAIFVCAINYARYGSIFEFGQHYQLTLTDCTKNHLSIDGVLPTIYHYFLRTPAYNKAEHILSYRYGSENFDIHPYVNGSIGLIFIPISLFILLIPYVISRKDDKSFLFFVLASPILIFMTAFINYCFAGVCPRYLHDFVPWAALLGGLIALKALEKDNGQYPVVPIMIFSLLTINILISAQYHFVEWDGLKIGDFNGLYGVLKTITNQYNV